MEQRRRSVDHELLLAQSGWVQGLARTLVSDPAGAEDVAQDTMLAALSTPPLAGSDVRSLRAWLARVATNLAHLSLRHSTRRTQREARAARPERVCSAAEAVERASQLQHVVETLLALEEPYRSAVLLRFFEGLSHAQIAERVGASPAAVRKRLSRGLERLRERMDREHGGDRAAWMPAMLAFARTGRPLPVPTLSAATGLGAGGVKLAAAAAAAVAALALAASSVLTHASRPERAEWPATAVAAALRPAAATPGLRRPVPPIASDEFARAAALAAPLVPDDDRWHEERRLANDEPESPPPAAAAAPVRGRVVDLFGAPLAGLGLIDAGDPQRVLGTTLWDGSFELAWDAERALDLQLADASWVALRSPRIEAATRAAWQLVVATPAVDLRGWVVDAGGRPVPAAELRVAVPEEAFLDLGLPLDATRPAALDTRTDERGSFALERVPALECARLETRAEGFRTDVRPVPLVAAAAQVIRLERPPLPVARLEGFVVFPTGEPAADAEVRLGTRVARSDSRGRFELPLDPGPGPRTLVASLAGWQQGTTTVAVEPGRPPSPRVSLGGRLYSISGKLQVAAGSAPAGWIVTAGSSALQSSGSGTGSAGGAHAGGDPSPRTTTGADGSFALSGLIAGTYVVSAVNPATLEVAVLGGVSAGESGVLVHAAGGAGPGSVEGRLLDPEGQPLAGGLVSVAVFPPGVQNAVAVGPAVATGGGGEFALPGGAGKYARLVVGGVAQAVPANGSQNYAVVVALPPPAYLTFDGSGWSPRPDSLEVLDLDGDPMLLQMPGGAAYHATLHGGRSLVLGASEEAATAVVRLGGQELARFPVVLLSGEVTAVGSGAGPTVGTGGGSGSGGRTAAGSLAAAPR